MNELFVRFIFYVFATLAVISALVVVTQKNPVRCVLALVFTFFSSAFLWLLQGAEFLALTLVLVYVGAVMTLFLFVVMMLNIDVELKKNHLNHYLPFGLVLVALLVGLLMVALPNHPLSGHDMSLFFKSLLPSHGGLTNTEEIGLALLTDYVFTFELAAVLLLVGIIAAITLTHRDTISSKRQNILKQLMVKRTDRIELVAMKSE